MGNKADKGKESKQKLPTKNVQDIDETDYEFLMIQSGMSRERIKEIFDKFNETNPTGNLNKEEFIKLYTSLRHEEPEQLNKIAEQIFRCFDFSHDGYIQFNEFLIGFSLTTEGDLRKRLNYAFWLYDKDNNGYLEADELECVLAGMKDLLSLKDDFDVDSVMKESMKLLDVSNDGKISKDEFINGLSKNYELRMIMSPFS